MPTSECRVITPLAARYLKALCRHWAHHLPVAYDETRGRVEFPRGIGEFRVEGPDLLVMHLECPDLDSLSYMEKGVGDHLARFAFREKPPIDWQRPQ